MFPLHDKTRRRICLAGFFLLCVVPTVLVAGWCIVRCRPGRVAAEAQRLSRELGLDVSLDDVQYPQPGVIRYVGLELTDPETGCTMLQCRTLLAQRTEVADRQEQPKETLLLTVAEPIVEAAALDRVGQWLHRMLALPVGRTPLDVRLVASEVVLLPGETPAQEERLREFGGGVQSFAGGSQAWANFRIAGRDALEPIRVRMVRGRGDSQPTVGFELDTGGAVVPCRALAWGWPALEPLGPQSGFSGRIRASRVAAGTTHSGWDGEIRGEFTAVDLGCLVSERFPHQLTGIAEVTIDRARFRQGRLEEVAGTLSVGPGEMSRSLWEAAVTSLQLQPPVQAVASGDPIPFEQLALTYVLDSQGLTLQGRCPAAPPGTILVDRYGRFLGEPAGPLPVAALLQTLVPTGEVRVPATRQTDWLMRYLPVPSATVAAPSESPLSDARFGLRGGGGR